MINVSAAPDGGAPSDLHSDAVVYSQVSLILVLAVTSTWANLTLIFTILRTRKLHTISNMIILNLAISDVILAMTTLPTWAVTTAQQTLSFHDDACVFLGVMMLLLSLESIATLAGIALDRYIHICHPLRYVTIVTRTRAAICFLVTWLLSFLLAILPLAGFGRYGYRPASMAICTVDYLWSVGYTVTVLGLGIVPQCCLICVCYCVIFSTARRQARKIGDLQVEEVLAFPPGLSNPVTGNQLSPWALPTDYGNRTEHWVTKVNSRRSHVGFRNRAGSSVDTRLPLKLGSDLPRISVSAPTSPTRRTTAQRSDDAKKYISGEVLWRKATKVVKKSVSQTRAIRTVLTIIGFFLLCWTPHILLTIYSVSRHTPPSHTAEFVTTYLALANSLANPIICVVVNREFRKSLLRLFTNRKQELLRAAVNAFMERSPGGGPSSSMVATLQDTSMSDITSEASDLALVRRVYQNYLNQQEVKRQHSIDTER